MLASDKRSASLRLWAAESSPSGSCKALAFVPHVTGAGAIAWTPAPIALETNAQVVQKRVLRLLCKAWRVSRKHALHHSSKANGSDAQDMQSVVHESMVIVRDKNSAYGYCFFGKRFSER